MRLSGTPLCTILNGALGAEWDHGRMSQLYKCREREVSSSLHIDGVDISGEKDMRSI